MTTLRCFHEWITRLLTFTWHSHDSMKRLSRTIWGNVWVFSNGNRRVNFCFSLCRVFFFISRKIGRMKTKCKSYPNAIAFQKRHEKLEAYAHQWEEWRLRMMMMMILVNTWKLYGSSAKYSTFNVIFCSALLPPPLTYPIKMSLIEPTISGIPVKASNH